MDVQFWYKRGWEDDKANCHVMGDAIPVRAAKAHQDITSEVGLLMRVALTGCWIVSNSIFNHNQQNLC